MGDYVMVNRPIKRIFYQPLYNSTNFEVVLEKGNKIMQLCICHREDNAILIVKCLQTQMAKRIAYAEDDGVFYDEE